MKQHTHRRVAALAIPALLFTLLAALFTPGQSLAAPFDEPTIVAADGTTETIDAINPPSRTAGLLALYTPEFGPSTRTNLFGAEAVLVKTGVPNQYRVIDKCTVWDYFGGVCVNSGDNAIPADGVVLSAAPGGTPDVRSFIRDHIFVGDLVQIYIPVRRVASRTLDAIDPTAATNPDGVDPNTGACYPGCRGANQFIMYTPASGDRTGTNAFGYEVTVVDGRIVARGGNNSPIPADGFVLSGHGSVGTWLSANTILGAAVTVDGLEVTITIDPSAYIFNARQAIARAQAALARAEAECLAIPYDLAQEALAEAQLVVNQAQAAFDAGDDQGAVDLAQQAERIARVAWYRTHESRVVEGRGLWVRPTETTQEAIEATLDTIAQAGFNIVYLETFYQGYTIFPSATAERYGIVSQRPQFAGFDPLQIWVEQAHARGIELHAWVENFYVGNDVLGGPGPILSVYPAWAAVEREDVGKPGPQPSSREVGYYFLDPAIPEARQYLFELYTELLTNYAVDGLHLDYIRYPISLPLESSFSYSDYSRQAFAEEYGVDPYTINPDDSPEQWQQWVEWRQRQVTSFVGQLRAIIDTTRPTAALSAAVFPDQFDSQVRKLQNWPAWVEQGWMDFLAGMSFGRSAEPVAADTAAMRAIVGDKALIYTGIYAPFLGLSADTMVEQITAIQAAGGQGVSLFDWAHLTNDKAEALHEGPFRSGADAPHSRTARALVGGLEELSTQIEGVYLPRGCLDPRTATPFQQRLDEIAMALDRADQEVGNPVAALEHARRRLAQLDELLDRPQRDTNQALAERLRGELAYYTAIVDYALTRQ